MTKTKMIILTLLVMLNSCKIPEYRIMERCVFTVFRDDLGNPEEYVCGCQNYDLNKLEPISEMVDMPLNKCEDLIGFNILDWTEEITPKGREIFNWVNDNCNTGRNFTSSQKFSE